MVHLERSGAEGGGEEEARDAEARTRSESAEWDACENGMLKQEGIQ